MECRPKARSKIQGTRFKEEDKAQGRNPKEQVGKSKEEETRFKSKGICVHLWPTVFLSVCGIQLNLK
jgi:hypothetical protein